MKTTKQIVVELRRRIAGCREHKCPGNTTVALELNDVLKFIDEDDVTSPTTLRARMVNIHQQREELKQAEASLLEDIRKAEQELDAIKEDYRGQA